MAEAPTTPMTSEPTPAAPTSVIAGATAPAIPPAAPAPSLTEALFGSEANAGANPAGAPATAVAEPTATPDAPAPEAQPAPVDPTKTPEPTDPAKPTEEPKPAEPTPLTAESYADLKLPEGLTVDDTLFTEFKTTAAELGIAPDKAPALLNLFNKALGEQNRAVTEAMTSFSNAQTAWTNEINAMPEFQGDRRTQSLAVLGRVMDEFGSPEVRTVLETTGAGNHPGLVKMLLGMASALVEDSPTSNGTGISHGPNGRANARGGTLGQRIFPDGINPNGNSATSPT